MFKDPFASFNFNKPFGARRSRNLFGAHTTPREWKHGARDIPFGMGAMSLYVDGTNGHDSNDGESWKTAKATIQEAVDVADSWTQIFIKSGTYAENVIVATDSISLIGQSRDSVKIAPATGTALTISNPNFSADSLSTVSNEDSVYSIENNGIHCALSDVGVAASLAYGRGIHVNAAYSTLRRIYASDALLDLAVVFATGLHNAEIVDSYLNLTKSDAYAIGLSADADNITIRDNTLEGSLAGVNAFPGASNNTIFHNNFLSVTSPIYGPDCDFFENYYSDHTNVDNGFGIATEPYTYSSTTDPRPVVCRNGWNSVSILRSLLRKKTAAQTTAAATDANGTAWVDLKTVAPTTSDIELYRLKLTTAGTWAGTAKYRIIIDDTKVYPFGDDKDIDTGILEDLIFSINVQINETCKIQFRSDNAGDGTGETVALDQLDYATVL